MRKDIIALHVLNSNTYRTSRRLNASLWCFQIATIWLDKNASENTKKILYFAWRHSYACAGNFSFSYENCCKESLSFYWHANICVIFRLFTSCKECQQFFVVYFDSHNKLDVITTLNFYSIAILGLVIYPCERLQVLDYNDDVR